MITKAAFFALLNDANNRIGVTAHISVFGQDGGKTALIIKQFEAPNTFISAHRSGTNAVQAAFTKYNALLNEWFEATTAKAEVEAAHAEALEMDHALDVNHQLGFYKSATMMRGVWVNLNHAEAITMNEEHDMNKARQKQQQTASALPKDQMVDVCRAFLRTTPASQEQIDAVANLTATELRKLIIGMEAKGARITAHLVKAKRWGYGMITFGYNGQLPPGTYHAFTVTSMKDARQVANRYNAMMWNF